MLQPSLSQRTHIVADESNACRVGDTTTSKRCGLLPREQQRSNSCPPSFLLLLFGNHLLRRFSTPLPGTAGKEENSGAQAPFSLTHRIQSFNRRHQGRKQESRRHHHSLLFLPYSYSYCKAVNMPRFESAPLGGHGQWKTEHR